MDGRKIEHSVVQRKMSQSRARYRPLPEQNDYVCFSASTHHSHPHTTKTTRSRENSACRRQDAIKTFVLDTGSRHVTSDADITVLNAPCISVLDQIVREVNSAFSEVLEFEFDLQNLCKLFDINVFVNSFLVSLDEKMCYPKYNSLSKRTRTRQRKRAKLRLRRFLMSGRSQHDEKTQQADDNKQKRVQINALLRKKTEAVLNGNVSCFVDLTSLLAEKSGSDAYISQGAFLHVLMEIQSGVRLHLTPHEYLDSAYDNLGMLAATTASQSLSHKRSDTDAKAQILFDASDFSKYVSRAVHALKRCIESIKKCPAQRACSILLEQMLEFLDENSVIDEDIRPRVYCSMGKFSKSVSIKNTPLVTFRSVLTEPHGKTTRWPCAFFVPYRIPKLDAMTMLQTLKRLLARIENEAGNIR